jgi:hypothetical protein
LPHGCLQPSSNVTRNAVTIPPNTASDPTRMHPAVS